MLYIYHTRGDILVALSGATTGKFGIYNECVPALLNQRVAKISPGDNIKNRYLYHYMNKLQDIIYGRALGCAQPNISPNEIGEIDIYVPEISEQDKISKILDKAQELIDKRKEQIEALDELVKSKFIEMFGNPVSNDRGWNKKICKNISSKIGSGATPKGGNSSYKNEGISLIRSMNVHNNKFVDKDLAFIDDEQAEKLRNVMIEHNDVLLNITGASVARCCIVPNEFIPARVNQHVAIIRCKEDEILPIFLEYQLTNENYQRLLWDIATSGGATREAITKQQIENLELIVPTIELQNKFIDFVKQVDKLKADMEKSLKELEDNFNSLMQRAFKGELF
ncbi:MAG: restriction endonuclease subunit S [Clostridium sp.]|uniref:restriction endonuclease subunit S n=1 Tax=Clostridium sp. TaxID=1506 RepID=UPI002A756088|nr:restriction endonuclease subunit S [Clostridium sp.]MDY2630651.1 restriction endonuclease subunit S [Clostridium sp.]